MSQILDNTGIKVWSTADYTQYFTDFIQELAGTTSTSNMKLLDDAIGVLQTHIATVNTELAYLKNQADDNGISVVSGKLCITYEREE